MWRWILLLTIVSPPLLVAVQPRGNVRTRQTPLAGSCPSLFVAVFTRRGDLERRGLVRSMWKSAAETYGRLAAKFVICKPPLDENNVTLGPKLSEEHDQFGDTIFLDCDEGYLNGTLTRKVLASMERYLANYSDYEMFMKTDDDTFIMPDRLCHRFKYRQAQGKDNSQVYLGVFAEEGETMNHGHSPCRDPSSQFYEPVSNFGSQGPPWNKNRTDRRWPLSAKGGPGYILSRKVVNHIVDDGIAGANMCNNEDKCVAVWVDKLNQSGTPVHLLNLPGTDGYHEWHTNIVESGKLRDYPYTLHHHLNGKTIACLHSVAKAQNPDDTIDQCFANAS